ncbi:MAG: hypothetical protein QME07_01950, partial [bacterium]|nr:hypothetical protein [bacterium]
MKSIFLPTKLWKEKIFGLSQKDTLPLLSNKLSNSKTPTFLTKLKEKTTQENLIQSISPILLPNFSSKKEFFPEEAIEVVVTRVVLTKKKSALINQTIETGGQNTKEIKYEPVLKNKPMIPADNRQQTRLKEIKSEVILEKKSIADTTKYEPVSNNKPVIPAIKEDKPIAIPIEIRPENADHGLQTTDHRPQAIEPKIQNIDHRPQTTEPKIQNIEPKALNPEPITLNPEPKAQNIEPKLQTTDYRLQITEPKIQNPEPKAQNIEPKLQTTDHSQQTTEPKIQN